MTRAERDKGRKRQYVQVTLFDTLPCELDTLTLIILLVVDALYFFPNVFDIGAEKV